jgi:GGDEF domain-containing protein
MVFKNATEGVMITDVEGEILAVNGAFSTITGYSASEALGAGARTSSRRATMGRISTRPSGFPAQHRLLAGRAVQSPPQRRNLSRAPDGQRRARYRWQILSYIAVFSDLSQQIRTVPEQEAFLSHHRDPLTQVANRQLLEDRLERLISLSRRSGVPFGLFRIDIDGFSPRSTPATGTWPATGYCARSPTGWWPRCVNPTPWRASMPTTSCCWRPAWPSRTTSAALAPSCSTPCIKPVMLEEQEIIITASLGCARFPDHGQDVTRLLDSALLALDQARCRRRQALRNFRQPAPDFHARSPILMNAIHPLRADACWAHCAAARHLPPCLHKPSPAARYASASAPNSACRAARQHSP